MMRYQQILHALREQNYSQALDLIDEDRVEEFFNPLHSRFFVNKSLLPADQQFWYVLFSHKKSAIVFQSEFIYPFLSAFWKRQNQSSDLIHLFADTHPRKFIESLRLSRTFLNEGLLQKTTDSLHNPPAYVHFHLEKMRSIMAQKALLEEELNAYDEYLRKVSLSSLLILTTLWWESSPNDDRQAADLKYRAVNELLTRYFRLSSGTTEPISREELIKDFVKVCQRLRDDEKLKPSLWRAINKVKDYVLFMNADVDHYCFDIKSDFDHNGDFNWNNRERMAFSEGANKLQAFETYHTSLAMLIVPVLLEQWQLKATSKNEHELQYNELSYTVSTLMRLWVSYLALDTVFTKSHWLYLHTYSMLFVHAKSRYGDAFQTSLSKTNNAILSMLSTIISDGKGHGFPIQVNSAEEFANMTSMSFKGQVEASNLAGIPRLLYHDVADATADVNLISRPLVKVSDDQYIRLLPLLSRQNIVFGAYLRLLEEITEEEEQNRKAALNFEGLVANAFAEAGLTSASGVTFEHLSGDVDVMVTEGNTVLVLELKRTKFRESSTGIWNEKVDRLQKGSLQLYKAINFLRNHPEALYEVFPQLKGSQVKIAGFVVSPWFEHDHELIGRYRKISWFEIRYALEKMEEQWKDSENRLAAFINLIEDDKIWPEIFGKSFEFEGYTKE